MKAASPSSAIAWKKRRGPAISRKNATSDRALPAAARPSASTPGGLALQILPGVAADAPGDGYLRVAVAEQRQDAAVALQVQVKRPEIVAQTGAAFAGQGEDVEVRGAVDVELRGDGAFQSTDRKARFVREGARQPVVALRRLDAV